jgi:hypothetical protein
MDTDKGNMDTYKEHDKIPPHTPRQGVVGNLAPGLFRVIKGLLKKQVHRIMNKG